VTDDKPTLDEMIDAEVTQRSADPVLTRPTERCGSFHRAVGLGAMQGKHLALGIGGAAPAGPAAWPIAGAGISCPGEERRWRHVPPLSRCPRRHLRVAPVDRSRRYPEAKLRRRHVCLLSMGTCVNNNFCAANRPRRFVQPISTLVPTITRNAHLTADPGALLVDHPRMRAGRRWFR
jgi:hypothetical protein